MPPLSLCELSLIEQLPPEVLTLIEQKAQNPQFAFVSSTFRLIAAAKIERVYLVGHRLSACQVTGSDLKVFFAAASRLKTLKISCFLERMFQDFLGSGVKSIENIEFAPGTILKEEVLAALLANLPYLKSLKAPRCDLTKMHLKHLKGAKYLERLDVSQSKYLFDGACKPLLSLTHLQALNLSSTEISGAALKILKPLPLLSLKIAGTAVSSSSLSFFLQERHLIELDIRNCPGLKEPLLWSLSLEKLELLKMDLWREVKGDLLLKWLEKVRPLRNFTFTGQDEKVLLAIAMRFTQLEVVHAVSLKESFEASLFPHLKKVHLSLRQLPRLAHFETRPLYLRLVVNREDPESLVDQLQGLQISRPPWQLSSLIKVISLCIFQEDFPLKKIRALLYSFPSLEKLHIQRNDALKKQDLTRMIEKMHLKQLKVIECYGLSDHVGYELKQQHRSLRLIVKNPPNYFPDY